MTAATGPNAPSPTFHLIDFFDGSNVEVKDLILRGSFHWTIVSQRCRHVTISSVRVCGSRIGNDDGIDPCNSSDVNIDNCFLRTDDDCIAIKGTSGKGADDGIHISNCTFWSDWANIFRIGFESRAPAIENVTVRNVDVIYSLNPANHRVYIVELQPGGNMVMENLLFEEIRINGEFRQNLLEVAPMPDSRGSGVGPGKPVGPGVPSPADFPRESHFIDPVPGNGPYIHNVIFRDIQVYGTTPEPADVVEIKGIDAKRNVDNVLFDNFTCYGIPLTANSLGVQIGPFVTNVRFTNVAPAGMIPP